MAKKNPYIASLEAIPKRLAKAKPAKAYELLHEAFLLFAAAGDVEHAAALIRLTYAGGLPRPAKLIHVYGSGPMDGFCAAAKLGDLTNGDPPTEYLAKAKTLADRVRISESVVRESLTSDAYSQLPAPKAAWSKLEGRDLWRKVQILARRGKDAKPPASEAEAFDALTKYMDAWCKDPEDRGAGYGQEVILALDLALRHGTKDCLARWIPILGEHLMDWGLAEPLCLPDVALAITKGLLKPLVDLPADRAKALHREIDAAANALAGAKTAAPDPGGKPTKRTVSAEYSQFYLENASSPKDQVFFQDKRESPQGMSIFATKVGIATPNETSECFVEIAIAKQTPKSVDLGDAAQAVSFPFVVNGPLFVRSVNGGGDDEDRDVVLPKGKYDVLARFFARRAAKEDAEVGLRAFRVTLDFHPAGALKAPQCLKLDFGKPPKAVFVNK